MGDETTAEALRIAERWLIKQGWKFTPEDVAARAKKMLDALSPTPSTEALTQEVER
jgi:hypothetical protein